MNTCKACDYWKDYKIRVMAVISDHPGRMSRGRIELRLCKFNPHPSLEALNSIYTDEDYSCSQFKEVVSQ